MEAEVGIGPFTRLISPKNARFSSGIKGSTLIALLVKSGRRGGRPERGPPAGGFHRGSSAPKEFAAASVRMARLWLTRPLPFRRGHELQHDLIAVFQWEAD